MGKNDAFTFNLNEAISGVGQIPDLTAVEQAIGHHIVLEEYKCMLRYERNYRRNVQQRTEQGAAENQLRVNLRQARQNHMLQQIHI